jgi:hypothetical protein
MRSCILLLLAVLLAFSSASGCYTVRYRTRVRPTTEPSTSWNHIFLWGLAGSATVDVRATCPDGFAQIETKRTFGNIIVSLLTLGIYSPNYVSVWCRAGGGERPAVASPPRTTARVATGGSR